MWLSHLPLPEAGGMVLATVYIVNKSGIHNRKETRWMRPGASMYLHSGRRTMKERELLLRTDDLLVDFDRAVHIFNEFVSGREASSCHD
jgi:hypothetical protein